MMYPMNMRPTMIGNIAIIQSPKNTLPPIAPPISAAASRLAPDPVTKAPAPILIFNRFCKTMLRPKLFLVPECAPYIEAITMKMGSNIAAFAVVAEMNAESTRFIRMKLIKIDDALFPNLIMNHSANRFATPVATSMLASTNDIIFSHMTG